MLSQLLALDPALRCYWPDSARYKTQLRNFASHASRCVNAQPLLSERFPARFAFLHLTSGEEPMALEANETGNLIGSDKVEGTAVYGGAPHYRNDNTWNWSDPTRTRAVNDYYGVAI
jgi:hypothetical protein